MFKIIENTIDDVISQIDQNDKEVLGIIHNVIDVTTGYIKRTVKKTEETIQVFKNSFGSDKKAFVLSYTERDKFFTYTLFYIGHEAESTVLDIVQKDLLKNTNKLEKARAFIQKGDL